ncbi:MAG: hypothetical protein AAGD43_04735 [Pseudomonadota bacterium]
MKNGFLGAGKQLAGPRPQGGFFPAPGSESHRDFIQQLAFSGMATAGQSDSPLLALLAPMVGATVTARADKVYEDGQAKKTAAARDQILGMIGGNDEQTGQLLDLIAAEDTPQTMRALASSMLNRKINPPKGRGGSSRRRMREDVNGILRYLDTGEQVFEGVTKNSGNVGSSQQINEATKIIDRAKDNLTNLGYTLDEADQMVRNDPLYAPQWRMIEDTQSSTRPAPAAPPVTELAQPNQRSAPPPPPGTVEF